MEMVLASAARSFSVSSAAAAAAPVPNSVERQGKGTTVIFTTDDDRGREFTLDLADPKSVDRGREEKRASLLALPYHHPRKPPRNSTGGNDTSDAHKLLGSSCARCCCCRCDFHPQEEAQ